MFDNYINRIAEKNVEEYLRLFGAISIEGPKYCGKTWLGRKFAKSEVLLKKNTKENLNSIEVAKMKPELTLTGDKPRLIDEWQEVPSLWDEVRYEVDKTGLKGQFILTGSSTPNRDGILHSGAGRFGKIRLRPFTLYESGDSTGEVSLEKICNGEDICIQTGEVDLMKLIHLTIRGGWPSNINYNSNDAKKALKEYIDLIITDDLYRLDGVKRDVNKVKLLLMSLARNECTTVTNATLKKDISEKDFIDIDIDTLSSYLNALDRLYLFDNDEPYSTNIKSSIRVKQAVKRHFVDPSLACAILNASEEYFLNNLSIYGFYFESMVERDLKVYAESFGAKCYHYQDYKDNEINQIIELDNGDWCAVEIKLGANEIENAVQNLLKIKNDIISNNGNPPKEMIVICGLSNIAYKRPDGVYVVPITALKN